MSAEDMDDFWPRDGPPAHRTQARGPRQTRAGDELKRVTRAGDDLRIHEFQLQYRAGDELRGQTQAHDHVGGPSGPVSQNALDLRSLCQLLEDYQSEAAIPWHYRYAETFAFALKFSLFSLAIGSHHIYHHIA